MGRYKCYLCGQSRSKERKISLHRYPDREKNPHVYNRYLAVCNLDEKDDVSNLRICSRHFHKDDLVNTSTLQKIKTGAIPSIKVPNPKAVELKHCQENNMTQEVDEQPKSNLIPKVGELPLILENHESHSNEETRVPHSFGLQTVSNLVPTIEESADITGIAIVKKLHTIDDLDEHFTVLYAYLQKNISCTTVTYPMETVEVLTEIRPETIENEIVSKTEMAEVSNSTKRTFDATLSSEGMAYSKMKTPTKKRPCFYPRYVAEIETSDVATPRSASRIIEFVKKSDREKTKKIKFLQGQKRRLQKHIYSLQELLSNLKEQGMILKDAEEPLLVND